MEARQSAESEDSRKMLPQVESKQQRGQLTLKQLAYL